MTEFVRFHEKLVIVSNVVHYRSAGGVCAYAPYAREVEIWADLFDEVLIAAPCRNQESPGDCVPFSRDNIRMIPQREVGGETWGAKIKLVSMLPMLTWELSRAIRQGDAVHVRCPCNLGLLGSLLAPVFSKHLVAKYAGQWNSNPNDGWSIRFQRSVLRSGWWGSPVTVYGGWPNQPSHVIPFFNSALTSSQLDRGYVASKKRGLDEFRHILFVGRLSRAKNVDVLLTALGRLRANGIRFTASIVGDGPELSTLQALSKSLGLSDCVEFTGGVGFDEVVKVLERSGILVLASETEGWPKAIVEAMAFGLVAIGSNVGLVPEILGEGRGLIVPVGDAEALSTVLQKVLSTPDEYSEMRSRAALWAGQYSIESLRDSLRALLAKHWGLPLHDRDDLASSSSSCGRPVVCR